MSAPPTVEDTATTEHEFHHPDREQLHAAFEAYLTRLGLRQTKQRRIILDAVLLLGPHVDAEAISHKARKLDPSIGLATVYRTLQLMTESGILVERQFMKDRARFEFADPAEHHDHLICNQCGAIIEFLNEDIERLQVKVAQDLGFELKEHRMELFADCLHADTCKRKEAKRAAVLEREAPP